jgi:ATPase subunit of ABC transporter with duplicated ATPase domains
LLREITMTLIVRDLTVEIENKTIVTGTSFEVRAGDKVGLVGRNGAGKTTLFRVLGGATEAISGSVTRSPATGYLSQDPRSDHTPPDTGSLMHVLSGRGLDEAMERIEKMTVALEADPSTENIEQFSAAHEHFESLGGYSAESEARKIADGLGLKPDRLDLHIGALSGGERRRLELTRILFAGSELLLLDEPTNHLDADARDWLLNYMRAYRGALIVISHDLGLLDDAITRVIHLDREAEDAAGSIVEYRGSYTKYLVAREVEEERVGKLVDRQEKEITRPEKRRVIAVRLPTPPESDRQVIEAKDLTKSFGAVRVFSDVCFDAGRGERLMIMGLNGAGKTTLLKLLADQAVADSGRVRIGGRTSMGYYAQEHEGIEDGKSLLDHMRLSASIGDQELRGVMGMFGLSGDKAFQDAATLSGGEKTKLALAQLVVGGHNLLLLDEPTNNLDPMSRTAVGEAFSQWPGTIILVSHDPEFVRALQPDRVLMMPEGQLDHFDESMLELVELA